MATDRTVSPQHATRTAIGAVLALLAVASIHGCTSMDAGTGDHVSATQCAECHTVQHEAWIGSHHDLAMQEVNEESVLGNFDDATFEHRGVTTRFFREGDRFIVNTEGEDGTLRDFEIKYAFGVEPLQQYLVELDRGRVQCLTIAWDTQNERWFELFPDTDAPPGDSFHWTGLYQNWNQQCAFCHSTNLQKNYDTERRAYATTYDAIDVSCEACHGSGAAHLDWAKAGGVGPDPIRRPARSEQIDTCAPCHARRSQLAEASPGDGYHERFRTALLEAGLYEADGQILEEVYVYGSFLQSKMHAAGVVCSDCHNPHSLETLTNGNDLCVSCHGPVAVEPFAGAAGEYDTRAHHHHEEGTEAAQCVSCHMPSRTYMVVDPRRDHSFPVPRPDLTVALGTPNACNDCHDDRSAQWAAGVARRWYGARADSADARGAYAWAVAAARAGRREAAPVLLDIARDPRQPGIRRATAVQLLRAYGDDPVSAQIMSATKDADPLVRMAAVGGLERLDQRSRVTTVSPLLDDSSRAVRIGAARVLAGAGRQFFEPDQLDALDRATADFRNAQVFAADDPGSYLNMAVLQESLGHPDSAEASYRSGLALDPAHLPLIHNLANLLNRSGRNDEAERVLRDGVARFPDDGDLNYSLGLLLAEMSRPAEALIQIERAATLLPERSRVHYNLALGLDQAGRVEEAEQALLRAKQLAPRDGDVTYALALHYARRAMWPKALRNARELVLREPGNRDLRAFLREIETRAGLR